MDLFKSPKQPGLRATPFSCQFPHLCRSRLRFPTQQSFLNLDPELQTTDGTNLSPALILQMLRLLTRCQISLLWIEFFPQHFPTKTKLCELLHLYTQRGGVGHSSFHRDIANLLLLLLCVRIFSGSEKVLVVGVRDLW